NKDSSPQISQIYTDFSFLNLRQSAKSADWNEPFAASPSSPAVVSPVADDADHDWPGHRRIDRMAAALLGPQSLFSARHFHQPDQIDHRAVRFFHHRGRHSRRGSIKNVRTVWNQS